MFDDELLRKFLKGAINSEEYHELRAEMIFEAIQKELVESFRLRKELLTRGKLQLPFSRLIGDGQGKYRIDDLPSGAVFRRKVEQYNLKPDGLFLLRINTRGTEITIALKAELKR